MKLVILESGAKARTIKKYLGKGWIVDACNGQCRIYHLIERIRTVPRQCGPLSPVNYPNHHGHGQIEPRG